jgi:hypothetical protein
MTRYEEMRKAAMDRQRAWIEMRDRCFGYLTRFANGLIQYIGVPNDRIELLKKADGEAQYLPAEEGKHYTLPGAIQFCEEDGYWHLGLAITLSAPDVFPSVWYGFVIMLKEDGKDVLVKTGLEKKEWRIPSDQIGSCVEVFESIAAVSLERLVQGNAYQPKGIGFLAG